MIWLASGIYCWLDQKLSQFTFFLFFLVLLGVHMAHPQFF